MRTHDEIMGDAEDRRAFSNSTEYEVWANHGRGCYDCRNDDAATETWCPILGAALLGKWPREWAKREVAWSTPANPSWGTEATSGVYETVGECSEFDPRTDGDDDTDPDPTPEPPPEADGQIDMFEVFAEQIVDALPTADTATAAR